MPIYVQITGDSSSVTTVDLEGTDSLEAARRKLGESNLMSEMDGFLWPDEKDVVVIARASESAIHIANVLWGPKDGPKRLRIKKATSTTDTIDVTVKRGDEKCASVLLQPGHNLLQVRSLLEGKGVMTVSDRFVAHDGTGYVQERREKNVLLSQILRDNKLTIGSSEW